MLRNAPRSMPAARPSGNAGLTFRVDAVVAMRLSCSPPTTSTSTTGPTSPMPAPEDDDDPYPWNDVLWVLYLALALLGVGGIVAFVWSVLT